MIVPPIVPFLFVGVCLDEQIVRKVKARKDRNLDVD